MRLMLMNVDSIKRLHPDAKFIVGDIGLSGDSVQVLRERGCEVIDFAIKKDGPGGNLRGASDMDSILFRFATFTKAILVARLLASHESVVFMDADAVLIRPLDFPMDKDATVTVREEGKFGRVNSGVFWMSSSDMASDWIQANVYRLLTTQDDVAEQKALIDAMERYDVDEVPCDHYNYPAIEKGVSKDVRVVHLKSGRWKKKEVIDELERIMKGIK